MAEYDNKNTFILFRNDKNGNEKAPDYSGTVTLADGSEKQLAAWLRESQKGTKFLSGRISEPYKPKESAQQNNVVEGEDDLPF
jgi:uncharacterized protein (DUF736 family)